MNKSIISLALFLLITIAIQAQECPCCTDQHKAFDFWIGQWEVTLPNGKFAGRNSITSIQDKCVLQENWVSATQGYTGTSNNFYNTKTKQWEQIWIDNQGASLHLKGNKIGNQMILQTDAVKNNNNDIVIQRVSWTDNDDGTVRQLWETVTQTTEGENIVVVFDGLYKPKTRP